MTSLLILGMLLSYSAASECVSLTRMTFIADLEKKELDLRYREKSPKSFCAKLPTTGTENAELTVKDPAGKVVVTRPLDIAFVRLSDSVKKDAHGKEVLVPHAAPEKIAYFTVHLPLNSPATSAKYTVELTEKRSGRLVAKGVL